MATIMKEGDDDYDPMKEMTSVRDLPTQITISVAIGLATFLSFCFLRTRWTGLYAARKKQKDAAHELPELPSSFFGWIPVVYSITEDQVLKCAGLDAFVFLRFFKMATKFLVFTLFFSLTVILPIHKTIGKEMEKLPDSVKNGTAGGSGIGGIGGGNVKQGLRIRNETGGDGDEDEGMWVFSNDYLWIYIVFVYFYTAAAIYLIVTETNMVIRVRQKYSSVQSSITDRTIRLSGVPKELQDPEKIKETVENLEIGKVESVTVCRDWKELDDLVAERASVLRKLEEAWTVHLGFVGRNLPSRRKPVSSRPREGGGGENGDDEAETAALLEDGEGGARPHISAAQKQRPTTRVWYGFLKLQSHKVDAINYYEEQLRQLDENIKVARQKEYPSTPLAFVTLDSIAACQMAIQARLDPEPMQFIANPSPAPQDVIWRSTYLPRWNRMVRAWSITFIILILTVFWISILIPISTLLNLNTIGKFIPGLDEFFAEHEVLASLARTGIPTLVMTILNALVPYLYDYLSNMQGMTSQGDIEMSVISKNFFFTFFTFFIAFTIIGTGAKAYGLDALQKKFSKSLGDLPGLANVLAKALADLASYYMNLIILQAFGILPLRLLEIGSVALYPVGLMGSKTPRDYAELVQPPVFSYGFFLPQTIFIFDVCIVYSILPDSEYVLLFGLIYFLVGGFVYKYQLLYAMDHRNFSTGRAWPMICNRIVVGLVFFQIAMAGQMLLKYAFKRSALVAPLLAGTIWFSVWYKKTFEPLTKFIALRSIHEARDEAASLSGSRYEEGTHRSRSRSSTRRPPEDELEFNSKFVNPSLIVPLERPWLPADAEEETGDGNGVGAANGDGS